MQVSLDTIRLPNEWMQICCISHSQLWNTAIHYYLQPIYNILYIKNINISHDPLVVIYAIIWNVFRGIIWNKISIVFHRDNEDKTTLISPSSTGRCDLSSGPGMVLDKIWNSKIRKGRARKQRKQTQLHRNSFRVEPHILRRLRDGVKHTDTQ